MIINKKIQSLQPQNLPISIFLIPNKNKKKNQKRPKRIENPRAINQTMWIKSRACPGTDNPTPLPTSQAPGLETRTPWHKASAQPHQYVTPSSPQTGSALKHLTGHEAGLDVFPQNSPLVFSEGNRISPPLLISVDETRDRLRRIRERTANDGENVDIAEIWILNFAGKLQTDVISSLFFLKGNNDRRIKEEGKNDSGKN